MALTLQQHIDLIKNDPDKIGFGALTTGGENRLLTVTTPAATGAGSFDNIFDSHQSGDVICFAEGLTSDVIQTNSIHAPRANVTISGYREGGGGGAITLQQQSNLQMFRMNRSGVGNIAMVNFNLDGSKMRGPVANKSASMISLLKGVNYYFKWMELFETDNDGFGIADPDPDGPLSASRITIAGCNVYNNSKSLLVNSDGPSCEGHPTLATNATALAQRVTEITIHKSWLHSRDRSPRNSGGKIHFFNSKFGPHATGQSYGHGTSITRGGKSIFESIVLDQSGVPESQRDNAILVNAGSDSTLGVNACAKNSNLWVNDLWIRNTSGSQDINDYTSIQAGSVLTYNQPQSAKPFDIPYAYESLTEAEVESALAVIGAQPAGVLQGSTAGGGGGGGADSGLMAKPVITSPVTGDSVVGDDVTFEWELGNDVQPDNVTFRLSQSVKNLVAGDSAANVDATSSNIEIPTGSAVSPYTLTATVPLPADGSPIYATVLVKKDGQLARAETVVINSVAASTPTFAENTRTVSLDVQNKTTIPVLNESNQPFTATIDTPAGDTDDQYVAITGSNSDSVELCVDVESAQAAGLTEISVKINI